MGQEATYSRILEFEGLTGLAHLPHVSRGPSLFVGPWFRHSLALLSLLLASFLIFFPSKALETLSAWLPGQNWWPFQGNLALFCSTCLPFRPFHSEPKSLLRNALIDETVQHGQPSPADTPSNPKNRQRFLNILAVKNSRPTNQPLSYCLLQSHSSGEVTTVSPRCCLPGCFLCV